jgi:hypothetical protein
METKFKQGRQYLIKNYGNLLKVKILDVTKTSYKTEWESGYREWKTINDFENENLLIEELEIRLPFNINDLKK